VYVDSDFASLYAAAAGSAIFDMAERWQIGHNRATAERFLWTEL
jgi:hypothetical protein